MQSSPVLATFGKRSSPPPSSEVHNIKRSRQIPDSAGMLDEDHCRSDKDVLTSIYIPKFKTDEDLDLSQIINLMMVVVMYSPNLDQKFASLLPCGELLGGEGGTEIQEIIQSSWRAQKFVNIRRIGATHFSRQRRN